MVKLLQNGWFDGRDKIVFIHTGGAAARFAKELA
jgi:1-aminocyclopropane-1-carboxylate deaminase/D-cysteine desulfhydrase-like pyridoxal-dependent ACC family enzyme